MQIVFCFKQNSLMLLKLLHFIFWASSSLIHHSIRGVILLDNQKRLGFHDLLKGFFFGSCYLDYSTPEQIIPDSSQSLYKGTDLWCDTRYLTM